MTARALLAAVLLPAMAAMMFVVAAPSPAQAQGLSNRPYHRPLVPRSQSRREADRTASRQRAQAQPRVYVPGHFAWDNRRGQYSWVAGRWERYDPNHAFVGGGLHFRNGQWTAGPVR